MKIIQNYFFLFALLVSSLSYGMDGERKQNQNYYIHSTFPDANDNTKETCLVSLKPNEMDTHDFSKGILPYYGSNTNQRNIKFIVLGSSPTKYPASLFRIPVLREVREGLVTNLNQIRTTYVLPTFYHLPGIKCDKDNKIPAILQPQNGLKYISHGKECSANTEVLFNELKTKLDESGKKGTVDITKLEQSLQKKTSWKIIVSFFTGVIGTVFLQKPAVTFFTKFWDAFKNASLTSTPPPPPN